MEGACLPARTDEGAGLHYNSRLPFDHRVLRLIRVILLAATIPVGEGCRRADVPVPTVKAARSEGTEAAVETAPKPDEIFRGRQIYLTGESPSGGKISGIVGDSVEVPARLLACANAMGVTGMAVPRSAAPSDLTWTALTRPYGLDRPDGRHRPPYTEQLLTRAIAMGLDSAGAPLDRAMPRYRLSLDDNADLIAYLRYMEQDHDPGVGADLIRIGVILPPNAESTGLAEAIRGILQGQVKALNERGGVYHRRVILRFAEAPRERGRRQSVVQDLTSGSEPVFAILAANLGAVDPEVPAAAEREKVPLLGVVAPPASDRPRPGRFVFFLLAGPDDQALALSRLALQDGRSSTVFAIVHGADASQRALGETLCDRFRRAGLGPPIDIELSDTPGSLVTVCQSLRRADVIVFLGPPGQTARLLTSLADRGQVPTILFPGTLADRDLLELPRSFDGHLQIALPITPSDQTAEGLARFHQLVGSSQSLQRHRTSQLGVLTAADVLVEGLRRAERGLSRERFVAELEHIRDFHTGLAPPLTFNPNRHVGARGAHAIRIDLLGHRLVPNGPWIDAEGPLPSR